jgi:NTP pyrophosphatase (non-canonical NTP hydrolase)
LSEPTLAELRRQMGTLKQEKGFEISLEQRLAYLTSEVGEVASEVLKLSRDGNGDVGKMSAEEVAAVKDDLGMEIYDVLLNLLDLAEMAGVDLETAFARKAERNMDRQW